MIDFVLEVVLYLVFIQYLSVGYHLFDVKRSQKYVHAYLEGHCQSNSAA